MGQQSLFAVPAQGMTFDVRGQARTSVGCVEVHDVRFHRRHEESLLLQKGFVHFAQSNRVGEPRGCYPDLRGHAVRPIGKVMFVPPGVRFYSEWGEGQQRSVVLQFDQGVEERDWRLPELNAALDIREGHLHEAMNRLARELETPGFASDLLIDALCTEILVTLIRYIERSDADDRSGMGLATRQLEALKELFDRPGPLPPLSDLANVCGMSQRHFCRMFRATTGQSVSQFASELRLAKARALLVEHRRPIKQIAWECGFKTPAGFSAAFRQATGLQPSEFRRSVAS
jgi:AraC family transcriptional regulator